MTQSVLVVVHPGSALGSATSNLGGFEARAARDALAWELNHWEGPALIIHGELSDELPLYPAMEQALDDLLWRNRQAGFVTEAVRGCDNEAHNQEDAIEQWVREQAWDPATSFVVTGAWYHPEDGSGCVGSVIDKLKSLGYTATVGESPVEMLFEEEEEDDLDEDPEPEVEAPKPRGPSPFR